MITYNHGSYLEEAINGVLNQDIDQNFELIVSDDFSTDKTSELVGSFILTHPLGHKIRYIRHDQNLGMSANFYWTLNQCKGEYIAYCEGDDYWTDPHKLQKQIDYLKKHQEFSFAFHRTNLFNQDSHTSQPDGNDRFFKANRETIEVDGFTLANGWQIGMQTLVFRRSLIASLSVEGFGFFRDIHLLAHLLEYNSGVCFNFFGSVYRIHGNGVHSKTTRIESLKTGFACFDELYRHYKKDYLRLCLSNYLHELIQLHIKERNAPQAVFYLRKLMRIDFKLKVLAYYLKELILSGMKK